MVNLVALFDDCPYSDELRITPIHSVVVVGVDYETRQLNRIIELQIK